MSVVKEITMIRKVIVAAMAAATLAAAGPVFAQDWHNQGWNANDRAQVRELRHDRAELRHDIYVHQRYGVRNAGEIARDRAELRHDAWALHR
jgi:hypothetical protein